MYNSKIINRIGLGTAQFGIKYGLIDPKNKVPEKEAFKILNELLICGINCIDTAVAYGVSEEVIGKFIKKNDISFNLISKLPFCRVSEIESIINNSLKRLNVNNLYGNMFHNFNLYRDKPRSWAVLEKLKKKRKIRKIGFSLYHTQELERLIKDDIEFDIIQLPYSVFDRRFENYFSILKSKNIELHVRSVFLQGLLFMNPNTLHPFFSRIIDKLIVLNEISFQKKLSILNICLKFVLSNKYIDKIIVGVHTLKQLKEIISSARNYQKVNDFYDELSLLKVDNEKILLPFNWNLN